MESWIFLVLALHSLLQYPQPMDDGMDVETLRVHVELRAKRLEEERIRLERELEQLRLLQQSGWAWGDLLGSALQHWQLWPFPVILVSLLVLWFIWRERSLRRQEHEEENDGANAFGIADANVVHDVIQMYIGWRLMWRIQWPVQHLETGCMWTSDLMDRFINFSGHVLSNSFYLVLQRAIQVGNAFEGWTAREEDVVYRFLVPMTPPQGHSFHLELANAMWRPPRNFHVRVELECTCTREQQADNMLCFLHHPEEELRRNQDPSLLRTLCTGSYLDVQKTGLWFYQLLRAIWPALPQSHNWHLVLLPSRRSCQFKVTNGRKSFRIEMLFGVQRGDSDVFVSSESRKPLTPRTRWLETFAVAEMKFFRHIARQAPPYSLHLKYLQFFTCLRQGLGFSSYTMKTIVMHLLNAVPVSQWQMRHFLRRIVDINNSLHLSLEDKPLNHFIVGNRRLPEEITLPPDVQTAETLNLFHRMAVDPVAHSQVISQYLDLQHRLLEILKP